MSASKGLVTHVIDPYNFWMQIGTETEMSFFSAYQQRLNDYVKEYDSQYRCDIAKMCPGFLLVAQLPCDEDQGESPTQQHGEETDCWERATVTRVDVSQSTVDVLFVDLGRTAILDLDKCRAIPSQLYEYLPAQAYRASLAGIRPLSKTWTSRATNYFTTSLLNQEVFTLILNYDASSGTCEVVPYTLLPDSSCRSFIHQMQDMEFGLITDNTVVEFLDHMMLQLDKGDETLTNVEEDWSGDVLESTKESDNFLKSLNDTNSLEIPENIVSAPSSSAQVATVTGFDYAALRKTVSITPSVIKKEKDLETQKQVKRSFRKNFERLDSESSQHDDQDFDTYAQLHDTDMVSRVYLAELERAHSDDGFDGLLEGGELMGAMGPKKPMENLEQQQGEYNNSTNFNNGDNGNNYYTHREVPSSPFKNVITAKEEEEERDKLTQEENNQVEDSRGVMSEEESYLLEKEIKEILKNVEENDLDYIQTSIYLIVEPDLDAQQDHLQVVICAIMEYLFHCNWPLSKVEMDYLAILDTYSDATEFSLAMIVVIDDMKRKFLKIQGSRPTNRHKKFAQLLALVCKQADDEWNERVCDLIQDHILGLVEKWTIFNRQRHHSGDSIKKTELLYLEAAETFLDSCYNLINSKYGERLDQIMEDVRFKLLQDGTDSSVRSFLLNMLLAFHSGLMGRPKGASCTVSTQTDPLEDDTCLPSSLGSQELPNSSSATIPSKYKDAIPNDTLVMDEETVQSTSYDSPSQHAPSSLSLLNYNHSSVDNNELKYSKPKNNYDCDKIQLQLQYSKGENDCEYSTNPENDSRQIYFEAIHNSPCDPILHQPNDSDTCEEECDLPIDNKDNAFNFTVPEEVDSDSDNEIIPTTVIYKYSSQELHNLNTPQDMPVELAFHLHGELKDIIVEEPEPRLKQDGDGSSSVDPVCKTNDESFLSFLNYHKPAKKDPFSKPFFQGGDILLTRDCDSSTSLGDGFNPDAAPYVPHSETTTITSTSIGNDEGDQELWHDESADTAGGDFLKYKKPAVPVPSRKSKKKSRGRPLEDFIQEQTQANSPGIIDDESEEAFSADALRMYEEMEEQGVGRNSDPFTSLVFGSQVSSSSKRSSSNTLFSSYRSSEEKKTPQPWKPSNKRFCTRCGSDDHVVYDCTNSRLMH